MKLYLPVALTGLLSIASAQVYETRVTKTQFLVQTSAAAPTAVATNGFGLGSLIALFGPRFETINDPRLVLPSGGSKPLYFDPDGFWFSYGATYNSQAELEAAFPAGNYAFTGTDSIAGAFNDSIALPATAFPPTPQITNFADAQAVDVTRDFELKWGAFAGAVKNQDEVGLVMGDDGNPLLFSQTGFGTMDVTKNSVTIPANSLVPGQTYLYTLIFVKVAGANPTGYPFNPKAAFASETRFTLVTRPDITPPTLTASLPPPGSGLGPNQDVDFYFSKPMDKTRTGIVWSATLNGQPYPLDPAKFFYLWDGEGRFLVVNYVTASGGWPLGVTLSWHLRPDPNAANAFRDLVGNVLDADYTGSFHTSVCSGEDFIGGADFGVIKRVDHLQTGPGAATGTPAAGGATFSAFFGKAGQSNTANPNVTLEFPAPPASLPHGLDVLSQATPGVSSFTQTFTTTAELDAAFPATTYALQLRDLQKPVDQQVTNSVVFNLGSGGYPPIPHFANFEAAQAVDPAAVFTLSWDAFTGTDANSAITVSIDDLQGRQRLATRTCGELTSLTILERELEPGRTYTATLTFTQVAEHDQTMPNVAGKGVAAVTSTTRMTLKTIGGVTAPVFRSIAAGTTGNINVTVDCTVGAPLTIQAATSANGPFAAILLSTNPPVSPISLTLPVNVRDAARVFLRAVAN